MRVVTFIAFVMLLHNSAAGQQVEFVVGDLRVDEGGQWTADDSPLLRPFGVDFDSLGRMFIVELEGGRVFRMDPDRSLHHVSGDGSQSYTGDGGPFQSATYNGMHNCAITPEDQLLIGDSWNHCVRSIDLKTGVITTLAGTGEKGFSGDGGPAAAATFDFVMCISLDLRGRTLHIADLQNRRIRAVDLTTQIVRTVAGNGERGVPRDGDSAVSSPLVDPRAVAADADGQLYILERGGHALRVVRTDGTIHTVAGTGEKGFRDGPALQAQFGSPKHICVDDRKRVYIADDLNGAIRRYDPADGSVSTVLGRGFGDERIRLLNPHGVCWQNGRLLVVDTGHNRILAVDGH